MRNDAFILQVAERLAARYYPNRDPGFLAREVVRRTPVEWRGDLGRRSLCCSQVHIEETLKMVTHETK